MNSLLVQFGLLSLVATIGFAWAKGDAADRAGATAVAVSWIATVATMALAPEPSHATILLIFDVVLATALLGIAIGYSSLWLGVAMLIQAALLALHAQHFGEAPVTGRTFVIICNAASFAQLFAIVAATTASWLRRARLNRQTLVPDMMSPA